MQNKFIFNTVKCFFYTGLLILTLSLSATFTGCGGSDDEETVNQREVDSINVYTNLEKSFSSYKRALSYNESSDDKNAAESFETTLRALHEIDYQLVSKPENYFWKQDYDELAKSVVEDYLTTQKEFGQSSLVFEFAGKLPVIYEKVQEVHGDREPLPGGSDIPLIRNDAVDGYIDFFSKTDRGRAFIDKCLYRSGKYFPIMRKILKFNNAPEELIYLSVQESGLSPTITSHAGAVGLWQFMSPTGYSYGLNQDQYRDDRRDFEKSTDAAARLLKDLYRSFDDWYLAFSAYNAGPGRVTSAIRKSGSKDYWTLRSYLPGETKNYVPSIIALSFVLRNPEDYGFKEIEYGTPASYDRVNVRSPLTLQKVAELCETDIETIRELNPEIINDVLPNYDGPYQLRIPDKNFEKFSANYEKSSDVDRSSGFSPEFAGNEASTAGGVITLSGYKVSNYEPEDIHSIASSNGRKKVSHTIDKKEALSSIAVIYDVRPVDIRIWNNISYGSLLKYSKPLDIYITEEKYKSLYGIKDDENGQKNNSSEKQEDKNNTSYGNVSNDNTSSKNDNTKITKEDNQKTTEPVTTDNSAVNNAPVDNTTSANTNTGSNSETSSAPVADNNSTVNSDNTTTTTEENTEGQIDNTGNTTENETVPETPKVKVNNNTGTKIYTVSSGDYLSTIANKYGVTVNELMEWNNLQTDKIIIGQKLKLFPANSKTAVHVVEEGENLTMIANEYGISLAELKDLNNLTDDKILVGQKLKVIETKELKKNSVKTSGTKKTYKVKKGETLASISEANDVAIQDLKKWNNIKSDKIMVGQMLKLYDDTPKEKVRKRKN